MSDRTVLLVAQLKDQMTPGLRNISSGTVALSGAVVGLSTAAFAATIALGKYGAAVFDTHTRTGMSIHDTQALAYAFEQTGGSASSVEGVVRAMTMAMRGADLATSEQREALDLLNLSYQDMLNMGHLERYLAITDALGRMTDATQRDMAAQALLGRQYQTSIALLEQAGGSVRTMTDQFDAMGLAMSEEHITALKNFDSAMLDVNKRMKVLQAEALAPLIPILRQGMDSFMEMASEALPELGAAAGDAAGMLQELFDVVSGTAKFLGGYEQTIRLVAAAYIALKISMLAAKVACGATGIAFISTGSIMAGFSALSLSTAQVVSGGLTVALAGAAFACMELWKAMGKAKEATQQLEEATNRASDATAYVADIILAVQQNANISEQALLAFIERLESLPEGTQGVDVALQLLNRRLYELRLGTAEAAGDLEGVQAAMAGAKRESVETAKDLSQMSMAELQAAMDTARLTITMLEQQAVMANGKGPFQAQIQAVQEYITQLAAAQKQLLRDQAAGEGESVSVAGLGTTEDRAEATDEAKRNLKEIHAEAERLEAERQAGIMAGLQRKKEQELADRQAAAEAEAAMQAEALASHQAYLQNMSDGLTNLFTSMAMASDQGKARLQEWVNDFGKHLQQLVLSKAFQMVFDLLLGAGGGGGIFGWIGGIFGRVGGGIQPGAVGGRIVGGSLGLQGDTQLVPLETGEQVLTRQQVRDRQTGSGEGGNTYSFTYSPLFSTASKAESAMFGKKVLEVLRREGVVLP